MSDPEIQNFENHRRWDIPFMAALVVLLIAVVCSIAFLVRSPGLGSVTLFLLASAQVVTSTKIRAYATTVQDRIIRLEMRLRLAALLTGDLKGREAELSLPQLVGLRFASDKELPDLTRKVLNENIRKSDDIKRLITDWQADFLRV